MQHIKSIRGGYGMKKKIVIGVSVLVFAFCIFCGRLINGNINNDKIQSKDFSDIDISDLPVSQIKGDFLYDINSLEEAVGIVDYVFLGKVESNSGTDYEDVVTAEDADGNLKNMGTPYTNYSVSVLENIKGNLRSDIAIQLKKHGGITSDQKEIFVFEKDFLPEVGKKYIFLVYAQPDGSLLVSGPNSNVSIENKMQMRSRTNQNILDEYKEAAKNEVIPAERERFISKYEE